ncbi:MAG TPA: methylmalonyl-CoA mutase family protein, partial [Bacillales bacterium]|nr:methylmalonyl-CoA mutase family protein [Bacillales bacterium]
LQGMINKMVEMCDFPTVTDVADELEGLKKQDMKAVARLITLAESQVGASGEVSATTEQALNDLKKEKQASVPILGITGTGGAGKSSLTDELVRRFLNEFPDKSMAILSIDPTKQKTGGALLGDRIRMNAIHSPNVYMRSLATRGSKTELSEALRDAISVVKAAGYDLILVETSGIGQGDAEITDISDIAMYVMTSEFGAPSQLEKIDMIDFADIIVINKFERKGSEDALRDVKKQYQRSHLRFNEDPANMPVYGTIASQFNDAGTNRLFNVLIDVFNQKFDLGWQSTLEGSSEVVKQNVIIPPNRVQYLHDIAETVRNYHGATEEQARLARRCFQLDGTLQAVKEQPGNEEMISKLEDLKAEYEQKLLPETKQILEGWQELKEKYAADEFITKIRDKEIKTELKTRSLSGLDIPKIVLPKFEDWGEIVKWVMKENVPGSFPFTAGVFPFKRKGEDPKRQFAGEGPPERTNKRFHYLSKDDDAKRLSTAFDSVTLYGEDPDHRPDIYGKVGESGVSICTLEDMKKLYDGFDLCSPTTSVSMTINGPAPIILAMFMNTAIDQQLAKFEEENGRKPSEDEAREVREKTLQTVRGTVQADILKEDQGQNTCIFSTEFALRMMGDIQEYFIDKKVRNYYSVSISGYHIAEAGANPITQLALTLSNGFTYVEYYLSRGMDINDFAPNLSFFFSNGLDPEYTVIGRVARRIWSVVMRERYGANERSQ